VHGMKDHCRNNVGNWPTRQLEAPVAPRGLITTRLKTARWRTRRSTA
jgi:hypothetical protein